MNVEHGGNLREFAARFGVDENEIVDFSSNINPLGLPESVRRLYLESLNDLTRYPDPSSAVLCGEIANRFSVRSDNLIAGNGAMSLLGLAVRTLNPRRALIVEPSFGEYRRILELQGTDVLALDLREQDGFRFNLRSLANVLNGVDVLVIGHPNNPTGTALRREEMAELLETARDRGCFVIVDEAFADWVPEISVVNLLRDDSNFLIVRSLTKFFALAGLRAGFALGPAAIIERMKKNQDTWSLNRLAEKLSAAMLRDTAFEDWSRNWFRRESAVFRSELEALGVFNVYPGLANFVLARLTRGGGEALFEALGRKGIYIRHAGNFRGLDSSFFRFAIRQRAENRLLIEGIRECLRLSSPSFSIS